MPTSEVHDVADQEGLALDVVVELGAIRAAGSPYADRAGDEVIAALVLIRIEDTRRTP